MKDEHDLVFPMLEDGKYRQMTESYVSHTFKKWATGAKLDPKLNLHNLRHSFPSVLVSSGVSLRTVQQLLGHQNAATTEIYAHLQKSELQSAVKLLDVARAKNKEGAEGDMPEEMGHGAPPEMWFEKADVIGSVVPFGTSPILAETCLTIRYEVHGLQEILRPVNWEVIPRDHP